MGSTASRRLRNFRARNQRRLLLLGLDNAGKTTVCKWMATREAARQTTPTEGVDVHSFRFGSLRMQTWDVGGQEAHRPLWRHYLSGTQGLVFVVDSSDRERFAQARKELEGLMRDPQLLNAFFLVLANKQDVPGAASPEEVRAAVVPQVAEGDAKEFEARAEQRMQVFGTVASSGDGVEQGLTWLGAHMERL